MGTGVHRHVSSTSRVLASSL